MRVYFGCGPGYLDILTLSYRWYGAVWTFNDQGHQIVRGYWFGDKKEDVSRLARNAGWDSYIEVKDEDKIRLVYDILRNKQQELDWVKRSRLPIISLLLKSWRKAKSGWYILRSRDQFPLYLSCLQKRGWWVDVVHVAVCESEADVPNFIDKVNREHNIKLRKRSWTDVIRR